MPVYAAVDRGQTALRRGRQKLRPQLLRQPRDHMDRPVVEHRGRDGQHDIVIRHDQGSRRESRFQRPRGIGRYDVADPQVPEGGHVGRMVDPVGQDVGLSLHAVAGDKGDFFGKKDRGGAEGRFHHVRFQPSQNVVFQEHGAGDDSQGRHDVPLHIEEWQSELILPQKCPFRQGILSGIPAGCRLCGPCGGKGIDSLFLCMP